MTVWEASYCIPQNIQNFLIKTTYCIGKYRTYAQIHTKSTVGNKGTDVSRYRTGKIIENVGKAYFS